MPRYTQTLGVDTVWRCGPAIRNHVLAKVRRGPTLPMMVETQPIVLVDDYGALLEARQVVAERRRKRGRPPNECISVVYGGPPPYCQQDPAWPESRANEYLLAGFDWWLMLLGPKSLIHAAVIHRDESAAHLHLLATPIIDGRVNWTDVLRHFLTRVPGSRTYTQLHTEFNEDVAAQFGLKRGVEGSEAKHEEPDRVVAQARVEIRLRQIHQQRQLVRHAGKAPHGDPALIEPEPWELELAAKMREPEEVERIKRLRKEAKLRTEPLPPLIAPLPPSVQTQRLEELAPEANRETVDDMTERERLGIVPKKTADLVDAPDSADRDDHYDDYNPDSVDRGDHYDDYAPDSADRDDHYDDYNPDSVDRGDHYDDYNPDPADRGDHYDDYNPDPADCDEPSDDYDPALAPQHTPKS